MKCTDIIATHLTDIHCIDDGYGNVEIFATELIIGAPNYRRKVALGTLKKEYLEEIIDKLLSRRKYDDSVKRSIAREIAKDKKLGIENPKILYHDFKEVSTRLAKNLTQL